MRTKKVTASLIVVFLAVAMFFSIGALADQSYYYDYKIKGSNVNPVSYTHLNSSYAFK